MNYAFQHTPVAPKAGLFAGANWCPLWPLLLILTLILPSELSASIGPLRLTPYRLVLLLGFFPSLLKLINGAAGKLIFVDWLIFFHIFWSFIVISYHHGTAIAIESGGIRTLELGGSYLIARANITNEKSFRGVVIVLITTVSLLAPLTFIESISGIHFIKLVASKISGTPFASEIEDRFGLSRAYGPFDHPILYGVYAASLLGLASFQAVPKLGNPRTRKFPKVAVIIAAMTSISSGALATLMSQFMLLFWEKRSRGKKSRWLKLTAILVGIYLFVEIFSNRSGIKVFLTYLTFSAGTAYNRIIIFEWGIQDVWRNPIWGIGFNEWTRPEWMHSLSMDNFWLVQAVTYGIPGFSSLFIAVMLLLSKNWKVSHSRFNRLRLGWTISLIGVLVASCTVHFWNSLFAYMAFLLGIGAWFHMPNQFKKF